MKREKIEKAAVDAMKILKNNLKYYTDKFPGSNTENQVYPISENIEWTTGFCTGTYWLSYELSGDEAFKTAAMIQVDSFYERIVDKIDVNHHDMGFLYTPSCVAAYLLTGSEKGKEAAIMAADQLTGRFQEKGQFLQAWGVLGAAEHYRLIIDCLLNLPLLYWASEVTGDERYRSIAVRHTRTSIKNLVREDFSTYHTYFFNPITGEPLKGVTAQGYKNNSAWARGQAWGIYGTALAWRYLREESCIELFKKVTDFYLEHLPKDKVPCWDLSFQEKDGEPRDSSAAAIAVCGILEMCENKGLTEEESKYYKEKAEEILESLIDFYAVRPHSAANGLLLHGVYAKSSPYNSVADRGVDECNLWGDYFYLEALVKNLQEWKSYW
ncbi:MAG TPA: glycoside hydrolase family 88 protein [Candidatus Blautia stercoravium]|nr:glycoside hydrolase family 88 protein [Candidatus Blautia stercoravium]